MKSLNDQERLTLGRLLCEIGVQVYVVQGKGGRERLVRNALLAEAAQRLANDGVSRLVIESCQQDHEDRRALQQALGPQPSMSYGHAGKEELLLALPDIHAWCWGRGGKFKDAVKPVTIDLGTFRF